MIILYWADWYANLLNVTPNINIESAAPFELGVSNEKFKMQGGKLLITYGKLE